MNGISYDIDDIVKHVPPFLSIHTHIVPNRQDVWDQLETLALTRDFPWFLTRDFNEIVDNSKKSGNDLRALLDPSGTSSLQRIDLTFNTWELPFMEENMWHTSIILPSR